jgi:hypothetical protein
MGAVASFIEDVGDAIGDVFEAVGDVVEEVGNFVGDVVEKVGDVVQAVLDDPLPVLLSVAGSFVGIPPAITMGAITAARGGDLEDIALSMGTAYFAPQVGGAISSTVSSTFIEAGFNEAFSEVAANSISKGLVNGTIAEVKGGSFEDGFAGGFTGGMVAGGVGEVGSYVKDDVIALAQESGLDLKDATSLYNAGTRAVSAGVTAEVTGRGDFATSFSNSAVGSSIDAGARSLNSTIDEQFRTAATDWNEKDKEGQPVDISTVGAGIPNDVVSQVQVSEIGFDTTPDTIDTASVLADSSDATTKPVGETATSDISILPETQLAEAPQAETATDFESLIGAKKPESVDSVVADASDNGDIPESVIDIAESLTPEEPAVSTEPKGALASMSEPEMPSVDLSSLTKPAVVSEAPVADNLLTAGLAPEQPTGGLNAVAQAAPTTPEDKMASSMGLKPTDITKPMVATVGSLLKSSLTQKKRPAPRAPAPRPTGGLQMAQAPRKPVAPPPTKMDVAKLIPIQKATPVAPPKKLASNAKLTPVTNIANLTSLVKKTG